MFPREFVQISIAGLRKSGNFQISENTSKIDETNSSFFFDRKLSVREAQKNGLEYPTKPVSAPYIPTMAYGGLGSFGDFPYMEKKGTPLKI